jgi:hypothetical protein
MPTPLEQLQEEERMIASGGNVAPTVGKVTPRNDLPSGWGADESGRIQRYNTDGNLNVQTPTSVTTATTNVPSKLSSDEYKAQYGAKPVDENAVREQIIKDNQSRLDAINSLYAGKLADDKVQGTGRLGSTRAINARGGLMGSDFGQSNIGQTQKYNAKVEDATRQEQALAQAGVFAKIDEQTQAKVAAQKAEALGDANAYKDYLSKAQTDALDYAKTLGASGLSLDELKTQNPTAYKNLIESSGKDEFTLGVVMNASKRKAEQIDYQYKTVGNKFIAYGINQKTGQIETIEKDLPAEIENLQDYNTPTTLPDGTVIFTPKQIDPTKPLQDQVLMYGAEGQYAKEQAPITKTIGSGKYARLVVSKDGGTTWTDALTNKPVTNVPSGGGSTGGGTTKEQQLEASRKGVAADVAAVTGTDGYIDTAKYDQIRENLAVSEPSLLNWFDDLYKTNVKLNPSDPTNRYAK